MDIILKVGETGTTYTYQGISKDEKFAIFLLINIKKKKIFFADLII